MKKIILVSSILIYFIFFCFSAKATEIELHFFYTSTCPHCAQEKVFLEELEDKYPELKISRYEMNTENAVLLRQLYEEYEVPISQQGFVPITFLAGQVYIGYDKLTGQKIENKIEILISEPVSAAPLPENLIQQNGRQEIEIQSGTESDEVLSLPILGDIRPGKYSPLTLSIIFGVLDGFNACAMVALGFLLTVLVATGVRKKVILMGGTFILVSGIIYFLFIATWFNLFIFVQHLNFINAIVGVIVIVFSLLLLRDYYKGIVCKACQVPAQGKEKFLVRFERRLFIYMDKIVSGNLSTPLMLLGIIVVSAGVNLIELACSFGFPLAFTKILVELEMSSWQYYLYLIVYIIFYMIDDFLIFLVAVITLQITQASNQYLKVIKLISGILLLILGLILLIAPEWLTFSF